VDFLPKSREGGQKRRIQHAGDLIAAHAPSPMSHFNSSLWSTFRGYGDPGRSSV
jgi:hypothetical protein